MSIPTNTHFGEDFVKSCMVRLPLPGFINYLTVWICSYHFLSPVVGAVGPTSLELFPAPQLTCGPSVNETFYDHLEGIANREYHPTFMEPDVAMLFKKSEVEDIDLGLIESNLRRAIEEVSIIIKCYNQVTKA